MFLIRYVGWVKEDGAVVEGHDIATKKSIAAAIKFCRKEQLDPHSHELIEVIDLDYGRYTDIPTAEPIPLSNYLK
jgi:hypothetical protein